MPTSTLSLALSGLLLATSSTVMAETLYRWIEADGSITFSPSPPPAGVTFETIGAAPAGTASIESANPVVPAQATATSQSIESPVAVTQPSQPARLSYAPGVEKSPSIDSQMALAPSPAQAAAQPRRAAITDHAVTAASNKRQHCDDLSKRVLSLERRLRSGLTPDDMDNTVIHMARYQKSFNQFCN